MKGERLLIVGILVTGAVALFAAAAAAKGGDAGGPPDTWHRELTDPAERAFVWGELQSRSGVDIFQRGPEYNATVLGNGNRLSLLALAILAEEGVAKMTAAERLETHAP